MSGAVCPACGVAVVPGYVRCPKCHRPLPRFARNTASPVGGTALQTKRGSPLLGIAVAILVGGGFIAFFALRGGKSNHASAAPAPAPSSPLLAPSPGDLTAPAPAPPPAPIAASAAQAPVVATPNPGAIASKLQSTLQRMELWSTVSVTGSRLELQSRACRDPQLGKQLDAVAASFRAAGLTRVRCLEQSGAVVFDREL
jgi:hypothetical protein